MIEPKKLENDMRDELSDGGMTQTCEGGVTLGLIEPEPHASPGNLDHSTPSPEAPTLTAAAEPLQPEAKEKVAPQGEEPMLPSTVARRDHVNDPDMSRERVRDLEQQVKDAHSQNKSARKNVASAAKTKATKVPKAKAKKEVEEVEENSLDPESEDSECPLDSDEDPAFKEKKAG